MTEERTAEESTKSHHGPEVEGSDLLELSQLEMEASGVSWVMMDL